MPSISSERLHLHLAHYGADNRIGTGGGHADEYENIVIYQISLVALAEWVREGQLPDVKTPILMQTLMLWQPNLFD